MSGFGLSCPPCIESASATFVSAHQYLSHPERVVDQHAMRDWIWDAMEQLREPLRLVLMLRRFSNIASYQEIAPGEALELWPPQTELLGILSTPGERCHPFPAMRRNRDKGITQHLRHVVGSRSVTIWETDVTNPAGISDPCPPTLAWLMIRRNRRVQTLRVVFPQPPR